MKKSLITLVALLFAFVGMAKAQVIEIGSGEDVSFEAPIYSSTSYSFTEQVYSAGEIGMAGPIHYLRFHVEGISEPVSRDVVVYMKKVLRSDFYDYYDYEPVSATDIVYAGTWQVTPGWATLVLDAPFEYDGFMNLLIAFDDNTGDYDYPMPLFNFTTTSGAYTVFSRYSSMDNPDPYDLGSFSGLGFVSEHRPDIRLGFTNCATPTFISAEVTPQSTHVMWDGVSSNFTLQYREISATIWTTVNNLSENEYTISDLTTGNYIARVQADCDPDQWVSTDFMVYIPESTAEWYAYALYSYGGAPWEHKFVHFNTQDIATVASSTMDILDYMVQAGSYAEGYVWIYDSYNEALKKAPITESYHLIGDFETVMENFSSNPIVAMQFNPVNERMYFIENTTMGSCMLKSFRLNHPETVSNHGLISFELCAFAINRDGDAYAIASYTGELFEVNLSNAELDLVGSTLMEPYDNSNVMAFDMETGELFWAVESYYAEGLYYVDVETANLMYLGKVGGDGATLSSMFMVYEYNTVAEDNTEHLSVYPNPANDKLYINGVDGELVRVYDNMGRMLMETRYNGHLDISAFAQGIYAVTVGDNTIKFVKE